MRAFAALALAAGAAAVCPSSLKAGEHLREVTVGGVKRRFYVMVPEGMPAGPRPGVVMLHGCGSSPEKFELESLMNVNAARAGFFNVYPEGTTTGTRLGFNAGESGQCQTGGLVNDVDFVRAVVLDMIETLCIDESRVFAAGFSNGGQMAFNLTCEMSDVFSGFGVTGMGQDASTYPVNCGLPADQIRPMLSACGGTDFACTAGYTNWVKGYAERSGCTDEPAKSDVSSTTTLTSYSKCGSSGQQPFKAYRISGLGHCWPGNDCCDGACLDQNPANIDLSAALLQFFSGLPSRKGPDAGSMALRLRRQLH